MSKPPIACAKHRHNPVKGYSPCAGCEVEVVAAYDFDTLAQRLQEAERLLGEARHFCGRASSILPKIDAFLAGKGDKP